MIWEFLDLHPSSYSGWTSPTRGVSGAVEHDAHEELGPSDLAEQEDALAPVPGRRCRGRPRAGRVGASRLRGSGARGRLATRFWVRGEVSSWARRHPVHSPQPIAVSIVGTGTYGTPSKTPVRMISRRTDIKVVGNGHGGWKAPLRHQPRASQPQDCRGGDHCAL